MERLDEHSSRTAERLKFIRSAHAARFSLKDIPSWDVAPSKFLSIASTAPRHLDEALVENKVLKINYRACCRRRSSRPQAAMAARPTVAGSGAEVREIDAPLLP